MKTVLTIIIFTFLNVFSSAQAPEYISYQAVIRNNAGELMSNTAIGVQISILEESASGVIAFQETHTVNSNANGLVTLQIGSGNVISGTFSGISWGTTAHFIKTEYDIEGGSNFTLSNISQFLSVPYAFHATTVEKDNVEDSDADPSNEIQNLIYDIANDELSISGGNTVSIVSSQWQPISAGIYYKNGTVSIGTTTPDPNSILHLHSPSINASLKFTTSQNASGASLLYYNNNLSFQNHSTNSTGGFSFSRTGKTILRMMNNGNVGIAKNGEIESLLHLGSAGGIKLDKETSIPEARTVYGNSMPIAYGNLGTNSQGAEIGTNYGIKSITKLQQGISEVTLELTPIGFPVVLITPHGQSEDFFAVVGTTENSNVIIVNIKNFQGQYKDASYSMVVFGAAQ